LRHNEEKSYNVSIDCGQLSTLWRNGLWTLSSVFVLLAPPGQRAESALGTPINHSDPVAPILIALMLIALGAMVGGRLMRRIGQPAVLGELLLGVLVANVAYYFHQPTITILREGGGILTLVQAALTHNVSLGEAATQLLPATEDTRRLVEALNSPVGPVAVSVYQFVDLLSRIGVIVLLFLVGLETSVREMAKVGLAALSVAVVGVVCPFLLGMGAMALLLPQNSRQNDLFIGAILTATSVAITARVFGDLKQSQRIEAKIILGAAVIDDVLALLVLAVVSAVVVTGTFSAVGLFMSWLANWIGLATIVGAFAAGLLLGELFSEELSEGHSLRDLLSPVESLIVPHLLRADGNASEIGSSRKQRGANYCNRPDRGSNSRERLAWLYRNCVKTPSIRCTGALLERKADSPSCCFFERSSEREERLERAGVRPSQLLPALLYCVHFVSNGI
jgi:Kef-type K+ transport system membrane component KefB